MQFLKQLYICLCVLQGEGGNKRKVWEEGEETGSARVGRRGLAGKKEGKKCGKVRDRKGYLEKRRDKGIG